MLAPSELPGFLKVAAPEKTSLSPASRSPLKSPPLYHLLFISFIAHIIDDIFSKYKLYKLLRIYLSHRGVSPMKEKSMSVLFSDMYLIGAH